MTEAVTITHLQNASGGILTAKEMKAFLEEIKTHPVLKDKPEALVNKAFLNALGKHRDALRMMEGEAIPFKIEFIEESCKRLITATEKAAGNKPLTHAQRVVNEFKHLDGYREPVVSKLTQTQKMSAGISFILAALSALGALSSATSISKTDEQGNRHLSATAVGFTLLQGALAAGMTYMGVHALRGAGRA